MEDIDYESLPTNAGLAVRQSICYSNSICSFQYAGKHVGWCTCKKNLPANEKKKVYGSLSILLLLIGRHFRARSHVPSRQHKSELFPPLIEFPNANRFVDANASFRNFPGGNLQRCR